MVVCTGLQRGQTAERPGLRVLRMRTCHCSHHSPTTKAANWIAYKDVNPGGLGTYPPLFGEGGYIYNYPPLFAKFVTTEA